jgi:hypothetical protein
MQHNHDIGMGQEEDKETTDAREASQELSALSTAPPHKSFSSVYKAERRRELREANGSVFPSSHHEPSNGFVSRNEKQEQCRQIQNIKKRPNMVLLSFLHFVLHTSHTKKKKEMVRES